MPNSLFNLLNTSPMPAPVGNMMSMIAQFQQFKQNFQGDPKEKVMELVNSGQISQEQLTQLQNTASQLQSLFK